MFTDIEETLGRELREVADSLPIPVMPALPDDQPAAPRHWKPILAAAAAAVVIAGTVAVVVSNGNEGDVSPAPEPTLTTGPTPSPTPTEPQATLPRTAPTIPYVLDQKLYVGGKQQAGSWWSVEGNDDGWLGLRTDYSWWWGNGTQLEAIGNLVDVPPVISPDGQAIAMIVAEDGGTSVTGFTTRVGGEGLGGFRIDPGNPALGDPVRVRAVTNDGKVIVQGQGHTVMWLPDVGIEKTVDLTTTALEQEFVGATPSGLVVMDGVTGDYYLAEISDTGELTRVGTLPENDEVQIAPDGQWMFFVPIGSLGGEVTQLHTLSAAMVNGDDAIVPLAAPAGWDFKVHAWAWEDDDHVVATVVGDGGERMARCSVRLGKCALIDAG